MPIVVKAESTSEFDGPEIALIDTMYLKRRLEKILALAKVCSLADEKFYVLEMWDYRAEWYKLSGDYDDFLEELEAGPTFFSYFPLKDMKWVEDTAQRMAVTSSGDVYWDAFIESDPFPIRLTTQTFPVEFILDHEEFSR